MSSPFTKLAWRNKLLITNGRGIVFGRQGPELRTEEREALRQAESRSGDEAAKLPSNLLTPTNSFPEAQIDSGGDSAALSI